MQPLVRRRQDAGASGAGLAAGDDMEVAGPLGRPRAIVAAAFLRDGADGLQDESPGAPRTIVTVERVQTETGQQCYALTERRDDQAPG